jgi:hypothetical protein
MTVNVIQHDMMMIGYDIYDCFTMEHLRLRQRMTLTYQNLLLATVHIQLMYFCSNKFLGNLSFRFFFYDICSFISV